MKADIHPKNHRPVIFHDNSSGQRWLIQSTIETEEKATWIDGKDYPLAFVSVSSASHPFYTGQEKVMDVAGRVERFKARARKADGGVKAAKKRKAL
jgi:large subunit ribosomal protein L31